MPQPPETQSYLVAAGLVVVGCFGLVVVWKLTKSLFKLVFWFAALLAVATAAWWLLARAGLLPPLPAIAPHQTAPAAKPLTA